MRPTSDAPPLPEHPDAPDLLHGGALYRVMRRFGVEPEHAAHAARRAVITGVLLWLPMAGAAVLEGVALPGRVRFAFLSDVAEYVRTLVSVPLLLVAEPILAHAWREAGERFRDRGIVTPECREAYEAIVRKVSRATQRLLPEVLCLALAGALSVRLATTVLASSHGAWFTTGWTEWPRLTVAGGWAAFVVHGILFYLSLRWLWLLTLWYRFLLGVARLPLRLFPAHPDRAAGLGFIGWSMSACAPLVFAWSAALSSAAANHLIHLEDRLVDFAPLGVVLLVFVVVAFVLPPVAIFAPLLARTRRKALEEWSKRLARWAEEGPAADAAPGVSVGGEVGGLEDLSIAVGAVRAIRPIPFALSQLAAPLAAAAIPAVPLLFVEFPAKEILDRLVQLLV